MSVRTTELAVRKILGSNYDGSSYLDGFMETASSLVDQAVALAATGGGTIISTQAELMERWLSAFLYVQMDPLYKSRSTDRGSGSFAEQNFLKPALALDPTGSLAQVMSGSSAGGEWLGKSEPNQLTYNQRN